MTDQMQPPPQFTDNPKARKAAEKAYAKANRPAWKKKRVILPVALVALIGISMAAGGGETSPTSDSSKASDSTDQAPAAKAPAKKSVADTQSDAEKNVTLDSCKVDSQFGMATVGYTILNPTSKSSMYLLDIKVIDSTGAAVGTANGIEDNVLPNRPSKGEAVGSVSDSAEGPFKCEIGEITRTSSSG